MGITQDFKAYLGLKISDGGVNANGIVNCNGLLVGNTTVNVSSNATVLFIGNSTISVTVNSTTFSGTANNASNLGGVAAASYVQNTDSRTLSGNLTIGGTNTVFNSNVLFTGTKTVGNSTVNVGSNSTVIFIGNSSVSVTINSTAFSGTAANATNLNGVAAASYVQNTDSRTLSGNLVLAGTNTVISSNLFLTGSTFSIGNSTVNVGSNTTVLFIGNSSVSVTVNSTSFSGTAANATNLGGVAAASYVQNTDSRTLSGNLTFGGTNTVFNSNLTLNGATLLIGNSTVGNVGIRNTAPTVSLHIGGNYQTQMTNLGVVNSTSNNTISFSGANYYKATIGGACTLTFSNIPAGSHAFGWIFAFSNVGSNITWPAAVKWPSATVPTFSSNTDLIVFMTHDAGTTIYGSLAVKDGR